MSTSTVVTPPVLFTNPLSSPYSRPGLQAEVAAIHTGFGDDLYDTVANNLGIVDPDNNPLSPLDILCHPCSRGFPSMDMATLCCVQAALGTDPVKPVRWNQFGAYNQVACGIMAKIHEFVFAANRFLKVDLTKVPSKHTLQRLGQLANSASTCLAVKVMWIYYVEYMEIVGSPTDWFLGNAAVTGPVKNYFAKFHAEPNISQYAATMVTNNIAAQLQMNPLWVNTAMWILGS